ncbi:hypothetical protein O0235_01360 [Tepidiforma flava]|uniref:Uncharacterized protein n=1 Tax=Tepidiforma flava TaxID=3004094 RepID=A0ABY7M9I3_9CHLR|nr:hypothetical protein [Tepidiforma flava]WBL36273.1 hypothetical protein O0235_01360 [Tepidiforma flava]
MGASRGRPQAIRVDVRHAAASLRSYMVLEVNGQAGRRRRGRGRT